MRKRYTEEQIIGFLQEADKGFPDGRAVPEIWFFRGFVLQLEVEVRRYDSIRSEAFESP